MSASKYFEDLSRIARRLENARSHLQALSSGKDVTVDIYAGSTLVVREQEVEPGPVLEALKTMASERVGTLEREYAELASKFHEVKP